MRRVSFIEVAFTPLFFLFIIFPLIALLGSLNLRGLIEIFTDKYFWDATAVTLSSALAASLIGVGLGLGMGYYHLFKRDSLIYKIGDLTNDLPIALPHTVAGLALLIAFGRRFFSFIGRTGLAFTWSAVTIAMVFVSFSLASRTILGAINEIPEEVIFVARSLGDTPEKSYLRIAAPQIREAIVGALLLAFSRSISEFAAVVMFGGNIAGRTQVLSSYVFSSLESGELDAAIAASVFCLVLSLCMVLAMKRFRGKRL